MPYDPLKKFEKSKDDWYPKPAKKRRLNLLPNRKYVHSKGTMVRVKVQPAPAIPCVVMRWIDGENEALPTMYMSDQKLLILSDSGIAHVFPSRSEAKKAIYHTVQFEKVPGGHVDFVIVNR